MKEVFYLLFVIVIIGNIYSCKEGRAVKNKSTEKSVEIKKENI